MADGNSELLSAFDKLAKTVNQIQISNSISRAQDRADQIRQDQSMNEFEKIKAQQALAQAMGTEVLARGGDAAHAEQARLSLAPQIPDNAMRQLESTGEDTLAGAQEALRQKAIKEERDKLKFEAGLKLDQIKIAAGVKDNKALGKQVLDYGKDVNPMLSRTGNFGKVDAVIKAADRIDGLFKQFPDYNIPKAQTSELATAIAAMVSGGSPQSQHQIDSVTPESMRGKAADMAAWVSGNPQGREQQKFMQTMHETALREKEVAKSQIDQGLAMIDAKHSNLFEPGVPDAVKAHAEKIKATVRSVYGLPDPAQANAAPSAQSPAGYPVGTGSAPAGLNKYIKINP